MSWTDFDPTLFEDGDILTEPNILTYIGNNLESSAHALQAPTTADQTFASTAAEETAYSVLIPGGSLGTTGKIYMEVVGEARGPAAGDGLCTYRAKWGGVTRYSWNVEYSTITTPVLAVARIFLMADGATGAQVLYVEHVGTGAQPTVRPPTMAVDSTVDQTMAFTIDFGTAGADRVYTRLWAETRLAKN